MIHLDPRRSPTSQNYVAAETTRPGRALREQLFIRSSRDVGVFEAADGDKAHRLRACKNIDLLSSKNFNTLW